MCPIIGERYRCKDCLEKIGFDLCQNCYQSSSKLPGRFNQQHREDHKLEKVENHPNQLIFRVDHFEDDDDEDDNDNDDDDDDDSRSIVIEYTATAEPESEATLPPNNPSSDDAIRNTSNNTSEDQECPDDDDDDSRT